MVTNILEQGPVIAIHQSNDVLNNMSEWCIKTHGLTGLTERVRQSNFTIEQAEQLTLDFIQRFVEAGVSPMCGNSIGQDRRFLYRYMPDLHDYFHYRNIDVSTVKELSRRWYPDVFAQLRKKGTHLALEDILESIEELKYYREQIMK